MRLTVSDLPTTIQALQELQRMHQLNLELLEQLSIFLEHILDNNKDIPNEEKFKFLLHKRETLLKELYSSDSAQILQYRRLSDDGYHDGSNRRRVNRTLCSFLILARANDYS